MTTHRYMADGQTIHAFRKIDGVWKCTVAGCTEKRDKHGHVVKERRLRVSGK